MSFSNRGGNLGVHRHHHRHHHHRHHHHRWVNSFEKPLIFIRSIPFNHEINVDPSIKAIKLFFARDFDNDENLVNVCMEIEMWEDNRRIPIQIKKMKGEGCEEQKVILVIPVEGLKGGKLYKVRIKQIFVDKDIERDEHRHSDRDFDRDIDIDFDRDFDRGRGRHFDRDIDIDFDRGRDFDRDIDIDFDRDFDRGRGRDFDRDIDIDFDRDRDRHHHRDIDMERHMFKRIRVIEFRTRCRKCSKEE